MGIFLYKLHNLEGDHSQHIRCVDYLTLDQLGALVLALIDDVFPGLDGHTKKRVRESWQEGVAKVIRLRNQVAHLRNVGFQDMQNLTITLRRMRQDIIEYGGWKESPTDGTETP